MLSSQALLPASERRTARRQMQMERYTQRKTMEPGQIDNWVQSTTKSEDVAVAGEGRVSGRDCYG